MFLSTGLYIIFSIFLSNSVNLFALYLISVERSISTFPSDNTLLILFSLAVLNTSIYFFWIAFIVYYEVIDSNTPEATEVILS